MRTIALDRVIDQICHPESRDLVLRFLERVKLGSSLDLRSPLYSRHTSREAILEQAMDIIKPETLFTRLHELEMRELDKVGPYSIMLPYKERETSVQDYFSPPTPAKFDNGILAKAIDHLSKMLPPHALRPLSLKASFDGADKSTNWGLPFFKKGSVAGRMYLNMAQKLWENKDGELFDIYPCLLGWRGQPKGLEEAPKQRVVWMYPHSLILIELCFQAPLINRLKSLTPFPAWMSNDEVDKGVSKLLLNANRKKVPLLSFDATAYDQSVRADLIAHVFDVIKFWFQRQYSPQIDHVMRYFLSAGIVVPDHLIYGRSGSVPSGSGMTNLIDSLVQLCAFWYTRGVLDEPLAASCLVQGDDGLWEFEEDHNLGSITGVIAELGLTANEEKQTFSHEYCSYLQKLYDVEGPRSKDDTDVIVGQRSLFRTLGGMISYERMRAGWTSEMDTIRWLSQLENAKHHPRMGAFLEWVSLGDKYRLGLAYPGGLDAMFKKVGIDTAKSLLGQKNWKFGSENLSEWQDFSIVDMLKNI